MRAAASLCAVLMPIVLLGCAALRPPAEPIVTSPAVTPESIRAKAVVQMKKTLSVKGRAVILARSPDSFRIEVFGPFGHTAALLASDGSSLFTITEDGPESYDRHKADLPYSLEPEDIVSFLLGNPRVGVEARADVEAGRDDNGRLRVFTRTFEGRPSLKVMLDDYREVSGAHIPYRITMDDGDKTLVITYREVEVNPPLEDELFQIGTETAPEGKEVD